VRTALARGVAVDLHPSTMTPHDVAVTRVGHINVVIWLRAPLNAPRFYLAVGRSYADSFEHFWRADEK
jgi:sarcosine oxidase subunit gamma